MAFMSFSVEGWGDFKIAKILPRNGTAWGIFSELPEDHPWRSLIPEVKEELIDLAISGHPKPFLDQGIRDANACLIWQVLRTNVRTEITARRIRKANARSDQERPPSASITRD